MNAPTDPAPGQGANQAVNSPAATAMVAAALLALYAAPAAGLIVALFSTNLATRNSWYFEFFFALATNHGDVMTEIHQLLLPLLSLFSIATFRRLASRHLLWLGALVLGSFLVVVGLEIWLGTPQLTANLGGWSIDPAALKAADGMLRRMRESQMMYLAILIGLRVPAGSKGAGAAGGKDP